ncbi:DUF4446 family protein [Mumia sp. zg.B17]|nr:DUF4446 family protein [Mumia sp. zg.B17]MBW9210132.1 DUF4446 family protein [Mumia sp. zg.B21]
MDPVALAVSLLALVVAALALGLVTASARKARPDTRPVDHLPRDTAALRREVAALADVQRHTFRHMAVVRYDAFGDTGGALSWSLALADDSGGGVVLTSIHGRNETRTYAKSVAGWSSEQTLTPEEERALSEARGTG